MRVIRPLFRMHRLSLATRAFLFSFVLLGILLGAGFLAINGAIHQRVSQDLREALHNSDELLARANADFAHENAAVFARLASNAALITSAGLLTSEDPSLSAQARAAMEVQLWDLADVSRYDFLTILDLQGTPIAEMPRPRGDSAGRSLGEVELHSSLPRLAARGGELFQIQSAPIEVGGKSAATLTLGRRFDLASVATGGEAIFLKDGVTLRSTFAAPQNQQLDIHFDKNCPSMHSVCEIKVGGTSYVASLLPSGQLDSHYQLLALRSLDAPLRAFRRALLPVLIELGVAGLFLAILSTVITSRSVSRPLRILASQLERGAISGALPEKLEAANGVPEVDLVARAFNRAAETERRSRNELLRAKQAAESANRLKTEFLTNVSHELRTPMNGVVGMTDLLLSTSLSEEQKEYAGTIRDSARSLIALIENILDFSEVETGRLRLKPCEMNLRRVFDDVVAATRTKMAGRPVTVEAFYASSIPQFFIGEETRIRQALMHLCDNAMKYTDAGFMRISVRYLARTGGDAELTFSVEDTGIGIAPENLNLVFEHFTQIDGSLTRRRGGMGIGLSITKALVELMGGRIGVKSSPNVGSTFWFMVPVKMAQPVERDPATCDVSRTV